MAGQRKQTTMAAALLAMLLFAVVIGSAQAREVPTKTDTQVTTVQAPAPSKTLGQKGDGKGMVDASTTAPALRDAHDGQIEGFVLTEAPRT